MVRTIAALYAVLTAATVWWAHHQNYGAGGYVGFIAIALVLVWALLWAGLTAIAVTDLVKHRWEARLASG